MSKFRRTGGYRDGAVSSIYSDGILRRPGQYYRQFSITIVSVMALSVLVALILTPALCATLLKPVSAEHHENKGGFFGLV